MSFFGSNQGAKDEQIKITFSSSSSVTAAPSPSDTNPNTYVMFRAELEDMIKQHRPKTEKEIKAESDSSLRKIALYGLFLCIFILLCIVIYFGATKDELPGFAQGFASLITTLVGGIGGFIYGSKK
ncbi:hypothetical protein ACSOQT_000783 [Yersinia enterocolitica]|uniref:Uncharacterized protein n=1 Tax=Yersinia enterocolitica TaxID=630 RepID=A0AAD2V238_YEREN|nr:hypothetical protein [Yersinia enterocolitica]HDT4991232.1 hypothetical protein [Enterobacter hormaechei subsp. xiangfangensis]